MGHVVACRPAPSRAPEPLASLPPVPTEGNAARRDALLAPTSGGPADPILALADASLDAEPVDADLVLGPNERYRDALRLAAERTGIDPAVLAAFVDAEAGRVGPVGQARLADEDLYAAHPELGGRKLGAGDEALIEAWKARFAAAEGAWDPRSAARTTSARGLTQFLEGTWEAQAERAGTMLHEVAVARGMLDGSGQVREASRGELLALRDDPTLSIVAAAELATSNVRGLKERGLVDQHMSTDERARRTYLAHHDGLDGAEAILRGEFDEEKARKMLAKNVKDADRRAALLAEHGTAAAAYSAWVTAYARDHIVPERFRTDPWCEER